MMKLEIKKKWILSFITPDCANARNSLKLYKLDQKFKILQIKLNFTSLYQTIDIFEDSYIISYIS